MQHGEKFNTLTHLIAAFIAFPGVVFLIVLAIKTGDPWKIISVSIYGFTLLLLYIFSSLYHAHNGSLKKLLQKFDHLSIYLLIAGTYTPFMLVTLRGVWGWSILGVVWSLAILGMVIDALPNKTGKVNRRIIPMIIYVVMGWLVVIPFKPLAENLASDGLMLLAIGGLLYTVGIIFFVLDHRVKHAHGIWHLFVIGGSVSHYISITAYVI